jgi:pyruvate ferredoxin oxidoreductase beta subunit
LEAALIRRGDADETTILAFAGDGGTVDIGIQALSGAIERGHDFIYICYDNEAYMNTGIQRSGSTPYGAWTTTTPVGKKRHYKREFKKDIPKIIAAHNIPYMATASVGYPKDYQKKVKAAKETKGPAFIQVHAPCPAGWKYEGRLSIKLARMAHACGMWKLFDLKEGKMSIQRRPKGFEPIKPYVKAQGRFKHLMDEEIAEMQERVDADIRDFYGIEGEIPIKEPKA